MPAANPTHASLRPVQRLAASPYARAKELRPIDLHLDANEGAGPSPEFLEAIRLQRETAMTYPSARALEADIAADLGIDPERVVVTAGADDALERICRAVLEPGRDVILNDPTFEMLPRWAAFCGAQVRAVPWMQPEYPRDAVLARITEATAAIFVVSPNNPTGLIASVEDIAALSAAARHALVVLDHAYVEFADEDIGPAALNFPNVVITRTFSKAWGLAGLRVGYAIAPKPIAGWIRAAGLPYACTSFSLAAAQRWRREGRPVMSAFIDAVREQRATLRSTLADLGVETCPSQGNFVLARFHDAELVADALAGLGIGVRRFSGNLADWLRITVPGDAAVGERLRASIAAAVRPRAILFDMDGVLADVSNSYREAVVRTCGAFGVTVSREQIAAAKRRGNANNDWILSRELLAAGGVDRTLPEVIETFEAMYQGTSAAPGLRATERLMVSARWLAELSQKFPLAIVTGRPRADALRFLTERGIADCFRQVVCMEDGPSKPDPAVVRIALERLGVRDAWMIGDTRDDITAARGAGVVPIGIVAPGDDAAATADTLLRAGAARILTSVESLSEVLHV